MTTKENIIAALQTIKPAWLASGVVQVGLFGSYLSNEQSNSSDIDLLINFEPGQENFDNDMAVYELFESLFENQKMDVVTKNGLSKYIGPNIPKYCAVCLN